MRRRDLLAGMSLVPLAAPAVAQCVLPGFPRRNLPGRCEGDGRVYLDFPPGALDPRVTLTRASVGTYTDASGLVASAPTDVARYDYDPTTLQLRGMLVEEARTNLVTNSQNVSVWAKTDVTCTANAIASPDGTVNATRAAEGVAGTAVVVSSIGTVTASTTCAFSVFVKRGNTDYVRFIGGDSTSTNGINVWVNLANGTTTFSARGSGTSLSVSSVALPNGWYRVAGTWNVPATSVQFTTISAAANLSTTRVNNAQYYMWGGQIEAGAFSTSLIPTTAAAATRAAEIVTVSVPAGTYASETVGGTVMAGGTVYPGTASSVAGVLTFAWPAAAVTAGERHLRRLVLRQTT
jgi:hypothetical protein